MLRAMGIPENLKRLRAERKLSQPQLAKLAGISQQLVSQIENGKNTSTKFLPQLAAALKVPVTEIDESYASVLGESTLGVAVAIPAEPPIFAGYVKAGLWLAVDEYFAQDEYAPRMPASVTRVPKYSRARQYAYQVRGDSMNQAGIEDGMWVIAADAADFVDMYGDIETGDFVVVERTRNQGAEREMTIKEIRYYRNRYELHPRSTDPEFQPIIIPHDHQADDGTEVRVVGVVLTAHRDLLSRHR